jgi:hypothetical protein
MGDEALFGLGEGLSGFAQSFNAARARKHQQEEQKRDNLTHLIIEGMKSPDFQGDKTEAFRHLAEIMGAKGKKLDEMMPMVGQMFGQGPEIPASERAIDPNTPLENQTRPRQVMGEGGTPAPMYGPTHKPAFRTAPEQLEFETDRIRQEANARAQGMWEAQGPYRLAEAEAKAKAKADEVEQRYQNHKKIIEYNIQYKIPAQARAQAMKEQMGLEEAMISKGIPKDEAASRSGQEVLDRYTGKTEQNIARTDLMKARTADIEVDNKRADAWLANAQQRTVQAARSITNAEERTRLTALSQRFANLRQRRAAAAQAMTQAAAISADVNKEPSERAAQDNLWWDRKKEIDAIDMEMKGLEGEVPGGQKGDGIVRGFGDIPGVKAAPTSQTSAAKTTITRSQYNKAIKDLGKAAADAEVKRRKLTIIED